MKNKQARDAVAGRDPRDKQGKERAPQHDGGGRREDDVKTRPRFVPSIGRDYDRKVVQYVLNGGSPKWMRLAKKMRIWSVMDLLKDYLDHADPNGGYYTHAGCLRRCGGMNDADGGTCLERQGRYEYLRITDEQ